MTHRLTIPAVRVPASRLRLGRSACCCLDCRDRIWRELQEDAEIVEQLIAWIVVVGELNSLGVRDRCCINCIGPVVRPVVRSERA